MLNSPWKERLSEALALYGHRNWIVVADAAYPAQCSPGVETVVAEGGLLGVLEEVLAAVSRCKHVRAVVHADEELQFVEEENAPGVKVFREGLAAALAGYAVKRVLHEEIIKKLDESARVFRALIIKTNLAIPYTSVFIELDCGYWSADSERKLRTRLSLAG